MSNEKARILTSKVPFRGPATENASKFILDGLERHKNETLLIDSVSGRKWTGAELKRTLIQLAAYLIRDCHLNKGDVCTLYHSLDDTLIVCDLAIKVAGGVVNLLLASSTGREVHDTSSFVGSKFLIGAHDSLAKIQPDLTKIEKNLCILSTSDPVRKIYTKECPSIADYLIKQTANSSDPSSTGDEKLVMTRVHEIKPEDYAVVQYSSGTTGKPKPIPRSHKNLCHLVATVDHPEMVDLHPGQVISGVLTVTHRTGLWAVLATIHCGNTIVLWDNLSNLESAMDVIDKYKVTIFSTSLPVLSTLANIPDEIAKKYDLTSWKHIITNGAKIVHDNLPKKLLAKFKLQTIRQCFGMTETGWCFFIENSLAKDNYITVGHVCPGMEAKVFDRETGAILPPMARGEVALRGPQVFPGYLTAEPGKLNRADFDQDGWFTTGDQAYYDDNDQVFIEGRFKELISLQNQTKFFPQEIESIIAEHPAIADVCVIKSESIVNDHFFDVATAFITLKHGCKVTEKEVLDHAKERCERLMISGGVKILDKIPKLNNGKVDKKSLAKLL